MRIENTNEEKNIGKAIRKPDTIILTNKLNFNKVAIGKKYKRIKDRINPPKNILGSFKLVFKTIQLTKNTIAKTEEKTIALINHVEPKRREKVVILFVSKSKNPIPRKKKTGFILNLLTGEKAKTDINEMIIIIKRENEYNLGIV